jgi:rhodanese-related sulfurtransferase
MRIRSNVLEHPAAPVPEALTHFRDRLAFETDCADVHADLAAGITGFTVVDCRTAKQFATGHVPGAVNLPHRQITADSVAALLPPDDLLVTYCNGPHCNASTRGAVRLVELGRRVKEMPGGMEGWRSEGLPTETTLVHGNQR